MSVRNRVKALEAWASARHPPKGAPAPEAARRDRAELLRHVPPDLRAAVGAAIDTDEAADSLVPWLTRPFARWAGAAPPDYLLPRSLVAWLLDPPRRYWIGHACERCGLQVPVYLTPSSDPHPLASIIAIPTCPACGGRTSFNASYQPATEGERCD